MIECARELDAFVKRAAGMVGEDPLTAGRRHGIVLQRGVLLKCGNAGVADQRHGRAVSEPLGGPPHAPLITDTGCGRSLAVPIGA